MAEGYVAPEHTADAFHCPHCGTYAQQHWGNEAQSTDSLPVTSRVSRCERCGEYAFWVDEELRYPSESSAPRPESDMPAKIKEDYSEARAIADESPRAAAALLRLATKQLLESIDAEGESPYGMLGTLAEEGVIDERVQHAYNSLRVYGDESVHPATVNVSDDDETAIKLFELLNYIVRRTITDDEFVESMYSSIPDSKTESVESGDESSSQA